MTDTRLLWHVVLAPVAGSGIGALLYGAAIRPWLTWPDGGLDVLAVLCGFAGLLAGGILSFRWSPWQPAGQAELADPEQPRLPRCLPLRAAGLSAAAVSAALLLAGVPRLTWSVVAAGVIGGAASCLLAGWLLKRHRV